MSLRRLIRRDLSGELLACLADVDTIRLARTATSAVVTAILVATTPLWGQTPTNASAATVVDFNDRVSQYIALHRKLTNETGEIDDTKKPAEITGREQALGKLIRANRANAKQGEIFAPAIQTLFKSIIKQEFSRQSAAMRQDRKEDQDELADFTPVVNQTYPPEKPLVTFPAGLLRTLPKLPKELEYRLVQRNLILRDIEANIIVDFVPAATP